jgi:hypothetical protein
MAGSALYFKQTPAPAYKLMSHLLAEIINLTFFDEVNYCFNGEVGIFLLGKSEAQDGERALWTPIIMSLASSRSDKLE